MQLRDHDAIVSKRDAFLVDPRKLKTEPGFNVRDLEDPAERPSLDELKEDIRENGVQDPLEIRLAGEDIYITSGHRRHKVVMELIAEGQDIPSIPALAEPKQVNDAERTLRLRTMNSGKPLTPIQNAEIVRRLLAHNWDRPKIAKRFGVSTQTVANYEELLAAPEEVREMVRTGEVSASLAVSTVRAEGPKAAPKLREARTAAKANGRSRITPKSFAPPVEAAERLPEPPRNQAAVDGALSALFGVVNRGVEPERIVNAGFLAMGPDDVRQVIEWLEAFEAKLRAKHEGAWPTDADAGTAYPAQV